MNYSQRRSGMLLSAILCSLSGIHVYWARGGRRGLDLAVPSSNGEPLFRPSPAATWVVAAALFGAAATVWGRMGLWGQAIPQRWFRLGIRGLGGIFFLRSIGDFRTVGWFKTLRGTAFAKWDTRLFSPLCAFISLLAFLTDWERDATE